MAHALQVRRPAFQFDEHTPFQWNPDNPEHAVEMNAITFAAPAFERYIVATVRKALPDIADPEVREEADLFLRQEAVHARAHRNHSEALVKQYPGLADVVRELDAEYDKLFAARPLAYHLAYVADIEATFTPAFGQLLNHRDTLFDNGDPRVASLFLWHFTEEIEHRSSALKIYDAIVPSKWYRLRVAPSVIAHTSRMQQIALRGFQAHVPAAERGVEISQLRSTPRQAPARIFRRGGTDPLRGVPLSERLTVALRLLRTQWPGHNPGNERLPAFAAEWLRGYDEGRDVVNWYADTRRAG